MSRSHVHLPITEGDGDLLAYVDVRLSHPDGTEATPRVFTGPQETAEEVAWPVTFAPALVDLWIEGAGRYNLHLVGPDTFSVTYPGIDFFPPAEEQARVVETTPPVANVPESGRWLAAGVADLRWRNPDLVAEHEHDGPSASSTLLPHVDSDGDTSALGSGATGGTTFGADSEATGTGTTLGPSSTAAVGGVTLGALNGSLAPADAVRLPFGLGGEQNGQVDDDQVLLRSLKVGDTTEVGSTFDVPVDDPPTEPFWVRGNAKVESLTAQNASIGAEDSLVGFFGSEGTTVPATPLDADGALLSLIEALQAYGLISQFTSETTIVPMEPYFDIGGRQVYLPMSPWTQYFIDGVLVEDTPYPVPGTDPVTVTVTAVPADGYTFADDPAPVTSWSASYPLVVPWDLILEDTLSSGTMDTSRTTEVGDFPWTSVNLDGPSAEFTFVDGWFHLDGPSAANITADAGSSYHALEVEYDFANVEPSADAYVRLTVNIAWGRNNFWLTNQGDGTTTLTATGTAVAPTLVPAAGMSLTGLPEAGIYRVECDGTTVTCLIDGEVVATAVKPADNNPGWAGEPTLFEVSLHNTYTVPGYTRVRNLRGYAQ